MTHRLLTKISQANTIKMSSSWGECFSENADDFFNKPFNLQDELNEGLEEALEQKQKEVDSLERTIQNLFIKNGKLEESLRIETALREKAEAMVASMEVQISAQNHQEPQVSVPATTMEEFEAKECAILDEMDRLKDILEETQNENEWLQGLLQNEENLRKNAEEELSTALNIHKKELDVQAAETKEMQSQIDLLKELATKETALKQKAEDKVVETLHDLRRLEKQMDSQEAKAKSREDGLVKELEKITKQREDEQVKQDRRLKELLELKDKSEHQNRCLIRRLQEKESEKVNLTRKVADLEKEMSIAERNSSTLRDALWRTTAEKDQMAMNTERMQVHIIHIEEELAESVRSHDLKKHGIIKEYESKLFDIMDRNDDLIKTIHQMQQNMENEKRSHMEAIAEILNEKEDMAKTMEKLQNHITYIEDDSAKELRSFELKKQALIKEFESQILTIEDKNIDLMKTVHELQKTMENDKSSYTKAFAEMQNETKDMAKTIEKLQIQLKESEGEVLTSEEKNNNLMKTVHQLQQNIETNKNSHIEAVAKILKEKVDLVKVLKEQNVTLDKKNQEMNVLKDLMRSVEGELERKRRKWFQKLLCR